MKIKLMAVSALAASILFVSGAFAAESNKFSDVDYTSEQGQAIEKMYSVGYLKGYNDGTFKPDATITRAELTRVFNQVFKYELNESADSTDFKDIEKDAWYYNDVKIAQSNGYINGFNDGTFRPQDNFTRQQTCVVLALAAGLQNTGDNITISDEVSPWAESYVKAAVSNGAFELEEGNTFRGTANITRGEVCEALAKYIVIETEVVTDAQGEAVTNSEGETETVTTVTVDKTTSSSNSGSSSGGGSGSSSGSDSSSGSKTTTTVTESSTETTTEESTTNSSNNTVTTEKVTETTTETTTEAATEITTNTQVSNALKVAIANTRAMTRKVSSDNEVALAEYILNALNSYVDDNSYDVASAAEEAKSMYRALSEEEKEDFKSMALITYDLTSLGVLQDTFGGLL